MSFARHPAARVRLEVEGALAKRVPGALSPYVKTEPERFPCGIRGLDDALRGGLAAGAITELVGAECSGRTTTALAYAAAAILHGNVAAWIDVDDRLNPESAALCGVELDRLLWVRCGEANAPASHVPVPASEGASAQAVETAMKEPGPPVPQGGGSPHPRSEGRGMPQAIQNLLQAQPRSAAIQTSRRDKTIGTPGVPNRMLSKASADREEQVATDRLPPRRGESLAIVPCCSESLPHRRKVSPQGPVQPQPMHAVSAAAKTAPAVKTWKPKSGWARLDQALRATDLLLQAGGFGMIVLDLGSTPAEKSWRIPLATWFRYRAACERTHTSLLLLTRHPCARSSAEVVARMQPGNFAADSRVLTGMDYRLEMERQRFERDTGKVVSIRKGPQPERPGLWKGHAAWAL